MGHHGRPPDRCQSAKRSRDQAGCQLCRNIPAIRNRGNSGHQIDQCKSNNDDAHRHQKDGGWNGGGEPRHDQHGDAHCRAHDPVAADGLHKSADAINLPDVGHNNGKYGNHNGKARIGELRQHSHRGDRQADTDRALDRSSQKKNRGGNQQELIHDHGFFSAAYSARAMPTTTSAPATM